MIMTFFNFLMATFCKNYGSDPDPKIFFTKL